MAIVDPDPNERPRIFLEGPQGNAYALLGLASDLGSQLGFSAQRNEALQKEMRSGDYENLITVFDQNFGHIVDLVRPPPLKESDFKRVSDTSAPVSSTSTEVPAAPLRKTRGP